MSKQEWNRLTIMAGDREQELTLVQPRLLRGEDHDLSLS